MEFFPFDLTGPQFLVFYPVFALGVAVLVRYWHIRRKATLEPVLPRLTDPCRIALLREGRREAVDVAVLSLIERGLPVVQRDGAVHIADGARPGIRGPSGRRRGPALLRYGAPPGQRGGSARRAVSDQGNGSRVPSPRPVINGRGTHLEDAARPGDSTGRRGSPPDPCWGPPPAISCCLR